MHQLSGLDVSFLNMESMAAYGHVSSLNIFDPTDHPGGAGLEVTKNVILERIDELAPFRWRLVEVPLGLDLPYWVEDPDFDIDFHVRHHAIPAPGTPEQLAEAICRIIARPLDRSRPLWELYVIEGVENGTRIAQLTKIHHAAIDGAAGALMLAAILDTEPDAAHSGSPAKWTPDKVPTDQELLAMTAREYLKRPEKVIRQSIRAVRELAESTQNGGLQVIADMAAQPLPGPLGNVMRERLRQGREPDDPPPSLPPNPAPRTPWNKVVSKHRRFAFTTIELEAAKKVRRALGCTFNDVVMTICSGALRRYLIKHDCLPSESLIAMVPISLRKEGERDTTDDSTYHNRVSALLADLATDEDDPIDRARRIQASMTTAKSDFQAIPAETLMDFAQFAPPAVATRAMQMVHRLKLADRMAPPFNVVISNVPGPAHPLYSGGAKLEHFYPVSTLTDSQGMNITVQSYDGRLDFGILTDRELVPDVWSITDMLHEATEELLDAI